MTGQEALQELLARIGDSFDGVVYLSEEELTGWPRVAVKVFETAGLLRPASPAGSAVCDGCERQCFMPVEVLDRDGETAAFIFCDKRDDFSRVEIPLNRLRRRQAGGQAIAVYLATALQMHGLPVGISSAKSWPVGVLRDKRSAHVDLDGEKVLTLKLAGHEVPLADVLTLKGKALEVDRRRLDDCVNSPISGGGTPKSAAERGERITRMAHEKGVRATALHFGLSESRIKQITKAQRGRSAARK